MSWRMILALVSPQPTSCRFQMATDPFLRLSLTVLRRSGRRIHILPGRIHGCSASVDYI